MKIYIAPILIAFVTFYLVTGFEPLIVNNIQWLSKGEPLTPYLGWEIFRKSPWEVPLGLNPRYGLEEISSSVVFSDSIPILAIFFKALDPILPSTFQYFGVWILISFLLQAIFAFKITGLITKSYYIQSCASILVLFLPAMLYRINVHISLSGHFIILWALYLNFKKDSRPIEWIFLILISLGSQFYLFVMVMGLWSAHLFDNFKIVKLRQISIGALFVITFITLGGWQFGYFVIPSSITDGKGYGIYQANILSFINPIDWSLFKANNFYLPRNHEGNNYLGLGIIGLTFSSTLTLYKKSTRNAFFIKIKQHIFLLVALIIFLIFAISNSIDIGKYNFHIPLNETVVSSLSTLRASGRMMWPLIYVSIITSVWLFYISVSRKLFLILITTFTTLQVIDTSKGWLELQNYFSNFRGSEMPTPLKNNFWLEVPKKYSIIRLVPPQNWYHRWADIATFSAKNNIATSLVYLSRTDDKKLSDSKVKIDNSLISGQLDSQTLYIFQKWTDNLYQPDPKYDSSRDLFAKIDDVVLLAPGFKICNTCKQINSSFEIRSLIPEIQTNQPVLFAKDGQGLEFLISGWAFPESWGIWSQGTSSSLAIPLGNNKPREIRLNFKALVSPNHPISKIEIYINGHYQKTIAADKVAGNSTFISIPENFQKQKFIILELKYLNPTSPLKAGYENQDDRLLTLGLESLMLIE